MKHERRLVPVVLVVVLSFWFSGLVAGKDWYVSPAGTAGGDGTSGRPLDLATALSEKSPAKPGDTIYLQGGVYEGPMKEIERQPFELGVSGSAENPIRIRPVPGQMAHLNGGVMVCSSWTHLIGLEIGDLKWDPWQKTHKATVPLNALAGTNVKVINCNLFGGGMGSGCWTPAVNLEIYGCLIHDFGYLEGDGNGRGHGHAFYAQNKDGTKVFASNIAYRGYGWNVHVYTEGGQIEGFDIVSNICFIAGSLKDGQTMDNYLVSGYHPADRIRLIGNVGYQPSNFDKWRPNVRLSSYKSQPNGVGVMKDNYLIGAPVGLLVSAWKDLEISGNTIWAYDTLVDLSPATAENVGKAFRVDHNTYLDNGAASPFKAAGKPMTFAEWQALGLDQNGKIVAGANGQPTGTKVFVFPNQHEKGRANVGIFNWGGKDTVEVDLATALGMGQPFAVYNVLDIRQLVAMAKPVIKGKFTGAPVSFPMRKDRISPNFDAFLVVPLASR